MQENNRQRARRQIDATILELMKGIEQEALGKPSETPTQKQTSSPTTVVNVNVYLCTHNGRFKRL